MHGSLVVQDYLREQPDNIKSVNLIAETARFLSLVYSSINTKTIGLVTELFNTLVEFTSVSPHLASPLMSKLVDLGNCHYTALKQK